MITNRAFVLINDERKRQDAKFGVQEHDAAIWSLIAAEELGEVAERHLAILFPNTQKETGKPLREAYIEELVQLTAVCVAWLECELRDKPIMMNLDPDADEEAALAADDSWLREREDKADE